MSYLEIENLTYFYPNESTPSLKNINLTINPGEFVLLVGGSGCGKSTLVKAIAGLVPEFYGGQIRGKVKLEGTDISKIQRKELVGI